MIPVEAIVLIVGLLISVVTIWIAVTVSNNKINTTQQLLAQTLNNQAPVLKQIYDDARGTHSTVRNTHERVGRIENVQACQGHEHESILKGIDEVKQNIPK